AGPSGPGSPARHGYAGDRPRPCRSRPADDRCASPTTAGTPPGRRRSSGTPGRSASSGACRCGRAPSGGGGRSPGRRPGDALGAQPAAQQHQRRQQVNPGRRGPHDQAGQLLIGQRRQAPGGGGRQMRGEQRLAGEGDQRAQQAHLDHGGQQGGDGRGRRGAQHRGPEDHGGSQQAQLHQPVGAVVRQGPAVGGRRVPHPEHQGLNGGGGRQRQRRVAPAFGQGHNRQRRGDRDQQGGGGHAGRGQGRRQGAAGGNEGQKPGPARGCRPKAPNTATPPGSPPNP